MTDPVAIWAPHLHPGERILWSATPSAALRNAEISRQRLIYGGVGAFSLLIALLLAVRFIDSLSSVTAQPSMLAAFTPLYLVFALAMGALALWGFRRMSVRAPAAAHYGATATRLLALDAAGEVIAQMQGADIDGVLASGRRRTPDVYVLRKNDPQEEHVFAIEHIDRPIDAKSFIEDTFLPEASAEPSTHGEARS